jgi:hypothetical protein
MNLTERATLVAENSQSVLRELCGGFFFPLSATSEFDGGAANNWLQQTPLSVAAEPER